MSTALNSVRVFLRPYLSDAACHETRRPVTMASEAVKSSAVARIEAKIKAIKEAPFEDPSKAELNIREYRQLSRDLAKEKIEEKKAAVARSFVIMDKTQLLVGSKRDGVAGASMLTISQQRYKDGLVTQLKDVEAYLEIVTKIKDAVHVGRDNPYVIRNHLKELGLPDLKDFFDDTRAVVFFDDRSTGQHRKVRELHASLPTQSRLDTLLGGLRQHTTVPARKVSLRIPQQGAPKPPKVRKALVVKRKLQVPSDEDRDDEKPDIKVRKLAD